MTACERQRELDQLREDLKNDPKVRIGASVMRDHDDAKYEALLPDGSHCEWDERLRTVGALRVLKPPPYPFCRTPDVCAGRGYCPRDPACND